VLGHIPGAGVPAGTPILTVELELESIQPSPFQPRRKAPQTHLEALADSIRQIGLLEPISVRPLPDGLYQIIAGECDYVLDVPCQPSVRGTGLARTGLGRENVRRLLSPSGSKTEAAWNLFYQVSFAEPVKDVLHGVL
jgi:hypothetical protein